MNNKHNRYNYERIKKLYWEHYNLYVIRENFGYKGQRYRRYVTYTVKDGSDHTIMKRVTLTALGDYLVSEGLY